jgi:hypothetical protein
MVIIHAVVTSITTTTIERRRVISYFFGGAAEVISQQSGKYLLSETSEISLLGCFVKAKTPFAPGTAVRLTITHQEKSFAASATVVYILAGNGMGLAFETVSPKDRAVLNAWLGEAREHISWGGALGRSEETKRNAGPEPSIENL